MSFPLRWFTRRISIREIFKRATTFWCLRTARFASRAPDVAKDSFFQRQPKPEAIPQEYRAWLGHITPDKTIPQIRKFIEAGGTVVTIGSSTALASYLNLPLADALVERSPDGKEAPLPPEKFYVPGSLLTVAVNNRDPLAYGMPEYVDVFFDRSPVFRLKPDAGLQGTFPVAWFPNASPLHSGWAWGQNYLEGGVAAAQSKLGKGTVVVLGPEVTFRGQPHATYKFLFNGIYLGHAQEAPLTR